MSPDKSLTIFLPKKLTQAGGTSTFARNFMKGMKERGHSVTLSWQHRYDVLLVAPTAPLRYLLHAKLFRRQIIHRLDGVYYSGSSAGWMWRLLNLQLSIIRTFFADAIVYQSKYSEYACNKRLLPLLSRKPKTTIYNGVDSDLFTPDGLKISLKDNPDQHVFITASRFRTEDQVIPLLKGFEEYRSNHEANSKLVLIGPFQERVSDIPAKFSHSSYISFLGTIPHDQLTAHLRAADIFVMTHKTPPCPNNVIEAMACGLPICGVADGAMPELVRNKTEGELVPEPQEAEPFPVETFANNLETIMRNKLHYARNSRQRAIHDFSLRSMLEKYNLFLRQTI